MAKCRECGEVFGPFDGKDGVCNKCLGIPMEDNSCIIETNSTPENKKNESSNSITVGIIVALVMIVLFIGIYSLLPDSVAPTLTKKGEAEKKVAQIIESKWGPTANYEIVGVREDANHNYVVAARIKGGITYFVVDGASMQIVQFYF